MDRGTGNSRLVYSTDNPCPTVTIFLERCCNGDVERAVEILTEPPCSYATARQRALALAHCLNLTPAEFVKIYWRKHRMPK